MGQISVTVNGSTYQLACADGEEEHIAQLAHGIDARIAHLVASVGQVGEGRLLLMASLMIADELGEARRDLDRAHAHPSADAQGGAPAAPAVDPTLTADIEALANRIEAIAARLKAT